MRTRYENDRGVEPWGLSATALHRGGSAEVARFSDVGTDTPGVRAFYGTSSVDRNDATPVHLGWARGVLATSVTDATLADVPLVVREEFPALACVEDLRRWLQCSDVELAALIGVPAARVAYWRQCARADWVPETPWHVTYPVFAVHSVLRGVALVLPTLGDDDITRWAYRPDDTHGVSPVELLRSGQIDVVRELAAAIIFPRDAQPCRRPWDWDPADEMDWDDADAPEIQAPPLPPITFHEVQVIDWRGS